MPKDHNVAVFYTIWSYSPGAGQALIKAAAEWLLGEYKDITNIVTLSPQTEMARRFHHKNGAVTLRENATSVNYEYYSRIPHSYKPEDPRSAAPQISQTATK
jgi:hypothetical protein